MQRLRYLATGHWLWPHWPATAWAHARTVCTQAYHHPCARWRQQKEVQHDGNRLPRSAAAPSLNQPHQITATRSTPARGASACAGALRPYVLRSVDLRGRARGRAVLHRHAVSGIFGRRLGSGERGGRGGGRGGGGRGGGRVGRGARHRRRAVRPPRAAAKAREAAGEAVRVARGAHPVGLFPRRTRRPPLRGHLRLHLLFA